nr:SAM-dependent methyltransferase [Actinocrispum wychmicini]
MTVTVIGVDGKTLPPGGADTVNAADLVVGAQRHLADHAPDGVRTLDVDGVAAADLQAATRAVVLADGDPGFFGVVRTLREKGVRLTVLPAVSALQRLVAAIGRPSDDVTVVDGTDLKRALNVCRAQSAVAVLGVNPAELAVGLGGWRRSLVVLTDDGASTMDTVAAAGRKWPEPTLVLCLAEADVVPSSGWIAGARPLSGGWAFSEDDFSHRDGLVTTAEVRALALPRLAPGPGTLVWDVGAGSGAVAVECARLGSAVLAVERDPMQCLRIMANASQYNVDVRVVEAELLAAISTLPKPDAVFVGGGGEAVLRACVSVEASRIVVALPSIDRVAATRSALASAGYTVSGCQLSAARLAELPDGGTRLAAVDPVTVVWGER